MSDDAAVPRTPPTAVVRLLRQEVGFVCPVDGCGSPYLTWHHFDPPWRIEHHHRPEGMIALCRAHADKADNRSFTDEQLRELKRTGGERSQLVIGRFDWRRRSMIADIGSNRISECGKALVAMGNVDPLVWLTQADGGYTLLNLRFPSPNGYARALMLDNTWYVPPSVHDLVCPPSGRLVDISFSENERLRVEFTDGEDSDETIVKVQAYFDESVYPVRIDEQALNVGGSIVHDSTLRVAGRHGVNLPRYPYAQIYDDVTVDALTKRGMLP